uniref:Uncharacterized protein n=1 Tax=Anguilla anguilla TaxID=7936 RepID=A0A0E9X823_ANGAN
MYLFIFFKNEEYILYRSLFIYICTTLMCITYYCTHLRKNLEGNYPMNTGSSIAFILHEVGQLDFCHPTKWIVYVCVGGVPSKGQGPCSHTPYILQQSLAY